MLLEAVPNLSVGPDDPTLDTIITHLTRSQTPAWKLLDTHTDPDHNRTVLTLAGAPAALQRALVTLIDAAEEHGSLEGHQGVHPRIGLIDVLPIVPLAGARDQDARRIAHDVADHLDEKDVPSLFYARLSPHPRPPTLAQLRKDNPWKASNEELPTAPDRGPHRFHPRLGATCVAIRDPLIAYNILLETTDLEKGRQIARELRAIHGGLPGVQALAFPLASHDDRVQVSTNITDVDETRIEDVYSRVQGLAQEAGITVKGGELVGLAPARALSDAPQRMGLERVPRSLEDHLRGHGFPT